MEEKIYQKCYIFCHLNIFENWVKRGTTLASWEASTFTGRVEKEEHRKEIKKGQWEMRTGKTCHENHGFLKFQG